TSWRILRWMRPLSCPAAASRQDAWDSISKTATGRRLSQAPRLPGLGWPFLVGRHFDRSVLLPVQVDHNGDIALGEERAQRADIADHDHASGTTAGRQQAEHH